MKDVLILMGSQSDDSVMTACYEYLDKFSLSYDVHVASAHRNPEKVLGLAKNAADTELNKTKLEVTRAAKNADEMLHQLAHHKKVEQELRAQIKELGHKLHEAKAQAPPPGA